MIREKINSLNDGDTLKNGLLYFLFFATVILLSLENLHINLYSILVFIVAGISIIVWSSKCYSLMKEIDIYFTPLFLLCGVIYCSILPLTRDELPVMDVVSYGDGATFSRLFSLPAFWIFKICGASSVSSAYFARYINLLCCTAMIWFSIRSIPYCKNICAVISLLPSAMRSIATASPDGTTLATSLLFISLALRASYTREDYIITKKYMFALYVSTILMLFCNISTFPLISLLFMIPRNRFGVNKRFYSFWITIITCLVFCILSWGFGAAVAALSPLDGLSRSAQLLYVIQHPFSYLIVILRTISSEGMHVFSDLLSSVSFDSANGSVELNLPWALAFSYIISFLYVCYFDSGLSPRRERIIRTTGISTLLFIALQMTFYYLSRTPLGYERILGINSGVFLPVLLPASLFIKRLCKHPAAPQKNFSTPLLVLFLSNITSAVLLLNSFTK